MTQFTRRRRPPASLCLTLAVAVLWAASGLAVGQAVRSISAKQPAQAGNTDSDQFVGPQKPGTANPTAGRARRNINARPAGKTLAPALPKPTVVLKPGEVPVMTIDTPAYEFGRVREGTEVVHDFWFTNTGNGPLEILRVKPS